MNDHDLHHRLIGLDGSRWLLNTPVLVLDSDALARNLSRMAEFARSANLSLRPHGKTHKSPQIAKLQLAAGAIGICCAKIGEAEVFADAGITDGILITSPVVSASAIERLVRLNGRTHELICVVDNPINVRAIGAAAERAGKPLGLLIDIDPGIHRTGVGSPEAAVTVLEAIRTERSLTYMGAQCYCGAQQHIGRFAERRAAMEDRAQIIKSVIQALSHAGAPPQIVTGGGTGTHRIDASLNLFTELQAGSYVFMDSQYLAYDLVGIDGEPSFEPSLMIDARVVSANTPGMVTIDAGFKALSTDGDRPRVLAGTNPDTIYHFMGNEHGALVLAPGEQLALGDVVTLSAPHCDPTVNLYDNFHVVQGDTLVALWPVAARGRSR
jgi:3-hydroxy-D-aspartate aldolase